MTGVAARQVPFGGYRLYGGVEASGVEIGRSPVAVPMQSATFNGRSREARAKDEWEAKGCTRERWGR